MMQIEPSLWDGRRVVVTGHTGFKGSWLTRWLAHMGAEVLGIAQPPETSPSVFEILDLRSRCEHMVSDVRDATAMATLMADFRPSVVFHLAAQALVRPSYESPLATLDTNVMGTANVLEAVRHAGSVDAVVVVTSDKCYDNREWAWGYREADHLGGHDPYSSSKACAEIVTQSYRRSFLHDAGCIVSSARAGNVLGGGDWSEDRLIPDAVRAFVAGETVEIRSPGAVRPWQHVLEPLRGYLLLAQRGLEGDAACARAYNFGPSDEDVLTVGEVVERFAAAWGEDASWRVTRDEGPHEAGLLKLDCSLARRELGWRPRIPLSRCLELTADWYRTCHEEGASAGLDALTVEQIDRWGLGREPSRHPQSPDTTPGSP
ncbi:MAG: CDP-glucose 4,6-dehydratase [Myxococcota bacterium]